MNIDEIILKRITALMESQDLNQTKLAAKAKIDRVNLNRLFNHKRSISKSDVLEDIAKALGVPLNSLKNIDFTAPAVNNEMPRSERLTLLYSIAPKLSDDDLKTIVDHAVAMSKK